MGVRVLLIAALLVCAATALPDEELFEEEASVSPMAEDPASGESKVQADFAFIQSVLGKAGNRPVLKKIAELKAYCLTAYDKASDLLDTAGTRHSSYLAFVAQFGSPDTKNKNAVTQYAKIMVSLRKKYTAGMGRYLLDHLHKAVLSRNKKDQVVRTDFPVGYVTISRKALGMTGEPALLFRLAVLNGHFANSWHTVEKTSMGADGMAALAWMKKGAKGKYKSFLARERDMWHRKVSKAHKKVVAAAIRAARGAFGAGAEGGDTKAGLVKVQAKPAWDASVKGFRRFMRGIKVPSAKAMKKAAEKHAKVWMKHVGKKLKAVKGRTKKMIAKAMAQEMSLHFVMTTAKAKHADSMQSPQVTVYGTKGHAVGVFESLPEGGKTLSASIPYKKNIGRIQRVVLEASGRDGWLVQSIKVRRKDKKGKNKFQVLARGPCKDKMKGCQPGPFWLDGKPFDRKATYDGYPWSNKISMINFTQWQEEEKAAKEVVKKERAKKEKSTKEKNAKEKKSKERDAKEKASKERNRKERDRKEKKAKKERSDKEVLSKERTAKERQSKAAEKNNKENNAKSRERAYKAPYWDGQCSACPARWWAGHHCSRGGRVVGERACRCFSNPAAHNGIQACCEGLCRR